MPAKSKSQQRLMGWRHACDQGKGSNCAKVDRLLPSIKPEDAADFARTKRRGLPNHVRHSFREYVQMRQALSESMDYDAALKFVLTKLRLPTDKDDNELETILSMPLRGYGKKAIHDLLQEPTLRQLPNFQTEILPALAKTSTTVSKLVGLMASDADQEETEI